MECKIKYALTCQVLVVIYLIMLSLILVLLGALTDPAAFPVEARL